MLMKTYTSEDEWMDDECILFKEPDGCEICHGFNGGVRGNENIVDGKIVCDYCMAKMPSLHE
jgi:hypothetical protein